MSNYLDFKPWLRMGPELSSDPLIIKDLTLGTAAIINTGDNEEEIPTNKLVQKTITTNLLIDAIING